MDVTKLSAVDTAPIHLKGLDGEYLYDDGKPVRIIVFGPGSQQAAAVEALQTARALKRMADNDGRITVAPPEMQAKEQAEDLAAITSHFENLEYPPAGDKQGAALFTAFYLDRTLGHLHAQVIKGQKNWAGFKPVSVGS